MMEKEEDVKAQKSLVEEAVIQVNDALYNASCIFDFQAGGQMLLGTRFHPELMPIELAFRY
jgi:hypothetical protein